MPSSSRRKAGRRGSAQTAHAHRRGRVSDTGQASGRSSCRASSSGFEQATARRPVPTGASGRLAIAPTSSSCTGERPRGECRSGRARSSRSSFRYSCHGQRRGRTPAPKWPPTKRSRQPALKVCVLVVDDEPDSNDVVSALLSSCGGRGSDRRVRAQGLEVLAQWRHRRARHGHRMPARMITAAHKVGSTGRVADCRPSH